MFIRNLHVESSKIKKDTQYKPSIKHALNLRSHCIFTADDSGI